ncbi:MAG TPA: hypothetical protein VK177_10285 [Flavobacteriales bacterium]|nr:hypothetical protein [Flavobacteriales bacterium]
MKKSILFVTLVAFVMIFSCSKEKSALNPVSIKEDKFSVENIEAAFAKTTIYTRTQPVPIDELDELPLYAGAVHNHYLPLFLAELDGGNFQYVTNITDQMNDFKVEADRAYAVVVDGTPQETTDMLDYGQPALAAIIDNMTLTSTEFNMNKSACIADLCSLRTEINSTVGVHPLDTTYIGDAIDNLIAFINEDITGTTYNSNMNSLISSWGTASLALNNNDMSDNAGIPSGYVLGIFKATYVNAMATLPPNPPQQKVAQWVVGDALGALYGLFSSAFQSIYSNPNVLESMATSALYASVGVGAKYVKDWLGW